MIDVAKFRMFRELARLSQAELAEEAGVSQQLIAAIETGVSRTSKSIYKIAAALGVRADQIDPELPPWDEKFSAVLSDLRKLSEAESSRLIRGFERDIAKALKNKK